MTLLCSWPALIIWAIVHAPDIVSPWSELPLGDQVLRVKRIEDITEEVEDQSQNSGRPVEPAVQLIRSALQLTPRDHTDYSPYPKHCIFLG